MTEHADLPSRISWPYPSPPVVVYCASPRAIVAAAAAYPGNDSALLTDALIVLHHRELGRDRSVCLDDVLNTLVEAGFAEAAEYLEQAAATAPKFGGPPTP